MNPNNLSLFLPRLRPFAAAPDDPSARLARDLSITRFFITTESHFPLLEAIDWRCDLAVLAFPGADDSLRPRVRQHFARLSRCGEMVVHADLAALPSLLAELAGHVWLVLRQGRECAVFASPGHLRAAGSYRTVDLDFTSESALLEVARSRVILNRGPNVSTRSDLTVDSEPGWKAVEVELARRQGHSRLQHPHNLWAVDDTIHVWWDEYQKRLVGFERVFIDTWLAGRPLGATLTDARGATLREAMADPRIRTSPDLRALVLDLDNRDTSARAPYYELAPLQRIGWLHQQARIRCTADFPPAAPVFRAGQTYPLKCVAADFRLERQRPNLFGVQEAVTLHHTDTIVQVGTLPDRYEFADWTGGRYVTGRTPGDKRHRSFAELCAHFEIPEVPSIAQLKPAEYQANLAQLDAVAARCGDFRWRNFQRDDLARFCLHPGGVFAWDKGGGKGLALYAIPTLYGARRTLIVAPEGLHEQIRTEWRSKFGVEVRRVMSTADIEADPDLKAATLNTQPLNSPPLFWLTSYTALGQNGADEWEPDVDCDGERIVTKTTLARRAADGVIPGVGDVGIGTEKFGIRCVLRPSLATLLRDVFDCVACDEAVRLKSSDSYTSLGVRRLRPRHAVALTGTPVKNRLEDLFWLLHWTAGGDASGNVRFPYPGTEASRNRFANLFMVTEENHSRQRKTKRRLSRVTNLHALWRTIGGLVLRRRKEDFGEDLVPKTIRTVRVLPGAAQWQAYRHALTNPPTRNAKGQLMDEMGAMLAQINQLRQLSILGSGSSLSPVLDACLRLIAERTAEGRQTMVASPFRAFSIALEERLAEAGLAHVRLDGDTSPDKRGKLAAEFKAGKFAVLIAGQQAMGEGYSFEQCDGLILPALHWAYDINSQVEDRVHRLTSKSPVTIYVLTTEGTIAEQLLTLYREKSDGSALAIDGRLFGGAGDEEVSLGALLRDASAHAFANARTIDERSLDVGWPDLREQLRAAAGTRWRHTARPVQPVLQSRGERTPNPGLFSTCV